MYGFAHFSHLCKFFASMRFFSKIFIRLNANMTIYSICCGSKTQFYPRNTHEKRTRFCKKFVEKDFLTKVYIEGTLRKVYYATPHEYPSRRKFSYKNA